MTRVFYVKKPSVTYNVTRACKHCGKEILKTFRGEFCCRKCADDYDYYNSHVDVNVMRHNKKLLHI